MKHITFAGLCMFFLCLLFIPAEGYDVCGDGLCGRTETAYSCEADCPPSGADQYCNPLNDDFCDPDCMERDKDCRRVMEKQGLPVPDYSSGVKTGSIIRVIILFFTLGLMGYLTYRMIQKIRNRDHEDGEMSRGGSGDEMQKQQNQQAPSQYRSPEENQNSVYQYQNQQRGSE